MSSIDVRKFVNINITTKTTASIDGTRGTAVLFTNDTSLSSMEKPFSSLQDVEKVYGNGYDSKVAYKYCKVYFESGGNELKVVYVENLQASSILKLVNDLPPEEIVIAIAADDGRSATIAADLAKSYNAQTTTDGTDEKPGIYGANQKIFLGAIGINDFSDNPTTYAKSDLSNYALKVGDLANQIGCEMTIAAYLSKINFYGINTVQDYAYTKENLNVEKYTGNLNDLVEKIIKNNANIAIEIAGSIRNIGGNLTNGEDLVNKFSLIVLHQTLSQRVLNTLAQKIKGSAGVTALYSTISQELNRYVSSGYLTTDKCWSDEDLTLKYNGKTYTLITQGTALNQGFKITILPLSSLTPEDKAEHKAPLIYVVLADSYNIRKVVINGEVI